MRRVGDKLTPKVNLYPAVSLHELFYIAKKFKSCVSLFLGFSHCIGYVDRYKHLSFVYTYLHVLHALTGYLYVMYTVIGTVREFN